MSTTIDSIQIEIQSNSFSATKGIDSLAESLKKLKSNGTIGVATKNLKSLSDALAGFKDASNVSRSLGKLSGAMERLKSIGSVSNIANSIKKLSDNLRAIDNIDIDSVAPQIERVANALAPLSAVKSGGINTMMNGLKKLGDVTKSLDEDTITGFTEKIERLNNVLGPLSQKMTTIQGGLKAINTSTKNVTVAVEKANVEANANVFHLSNVISVIQGVVQALQAVVQKITQVMDAAIEWDGIAARFGRGFGASAQDTYDWIQRLNEEMGINVQQFMQYSSVYATMLTGFGVAMEDAGKMALGYTELTYDIWAGYNDIYAGFADAAEAVKSAIAGEVEPIRRAGFTIVESTLEQTAANHGLNISLEKATEAQKSYLRYLTLVDQAHSQGLIGTYAKELQTAEGLMRTFAQQTKSLAQAFGSLFLPILVEIMPWVQAFVELLTEAVHIVAGFFGVEIQEVDWSGYGEGSGAIDGVTDSATGATGALKDAAEAAKELKNASLGMDELNVISPPSASSGSGGSGGTGSGGTGFENLDVDSLWDDSIFKNIGNQVDEIKEKIKEWLPVIETVAGLFAGLGIALLLAQLGEGMEAIGKMEGLVGGLKKTLAGLAILTIEAVLVFMLSDEYLETGNLMALVGEALATATSGYLMYKGFGKNGIIAATAVSVAMQVAAITLNLADGGVEMDDPELWIQSIMSVVTGTAGGLFAFKGVKSVGAGKGALLGMTLSASLTLAAITIGEITANGEVTGASIMTGLGSIVSAAGFGFTVGGAWGAAIGAGVSLVANIVGAIIGTVSKKAELSLKEDLEKRFGEVELTTEEVTAYVELITAIPRDVTIDANVWNEKIDGYEVQNMTVPVDVAFTIFDEESEVLDSLRSSVNTMAEKISRDAMKITLGIEISHGDYTASINAYVEEAQGYLDQYYLTTSIAIQLSPGESTSSLTSTLTTFYTNSSTELKALGEKLKNTVSEAFVDGKWIPDKLKEALKLQQEIQGIIDYTTDVEYRATLQNLKLSLSGTDITPESFNKVLDGAREAVEKKLESLEEVKMSKLQVAIMEYDANITEGKSEEEAKEIYNDTVKDIEAEYEKGKLEVSYGTVDFGLTTIHEAFTKEIAAARASGLLKYSTTIDLFLETRPEFVYEKDGKEVYSKRIELMVSELGYYMKSASLELSAEARKNLENTLNALKPTMTDYEEVAAENRKLGQAVPKEVLAGLNDYNELQAISGSVEGINYMIGKGFSGDPVFLNTLATVEGAGKDIDASVAKGLLNNIGYVRDQATGVVTGIKNSVTGEVTLITPTLRDNMKAMGVDLSAGLAEGVKSDEKTLWEKLGGWCGGIVNSVKGFFGIHSPSTVMRDEVGKYLSSGLSGGMEKNAVKDKLSTMWNTAKTWWDEKKGTMKTYTPNIGSIYQKVKDRWDSARTWWNDKKSAMKQYTPSIGSIYEKVSDRWKNARDWWNGKKSAMKTYTPSIGSITDKLKSAWNSAKSWWSKNVKLSTKLNVSVPTIKVKWDTASAFGKSFKYPTGFSLKFAANGGIFDTGSLIWAGERGPEVMATAAGGKTGVMNVQQMQDAVYDGVYAAVVAAMQATQGGGEQAVNVYLDGKQITSAVERRQRERGAAILGNQVYSY